MDSVPAPTTEPAPSPASRTTAEPAIAGIGSRWVWAGLSVTVLALVAALLYSGSAAARIAADPGAFVRWGLPIADAAHNVSLAAVIGSLIFAVIILPQRVGMRRRTGSSAASHRRDQANATTAPSGAAATTVPSGAAATTAERNIKAEPEHPAFARVMLLASMASVIWTLSAIAVLVLTFSDVAGQPLSSGEQYTSQLLYFMSDLPTGRAWLAVSIIAAVVTTLTFGVRSLTGLGLTALLAMSALVPMSLIGHAAGAADHEGAVSSLGLHLIGVCVWVGGIIALAVVSKQLRGGQPVTSAAAEAPRTRDITAVVLGRFSTLAGFAFILVFVSGVINASVRLGSLGSLASDYGILVLIKIFLTLLLGAIGFMHRQWVLPQLAAKNAGRAMSATRALWQLIFAELIIMGATSGVAVGLSRTATPVPEVLSPDATPAQILTGYALPPELTPSRWLTEWRFDWLWVAFAIAAAVGYLAGMHKVRRRGDSWPVPRGICWIIGLLALTYFTSGPPAVYGRILFSAHMVDHMALTMVVPIFLVLGAPVTLALKALPPRGDGSRGVREWILVIVHSKLSALITHPIFVAVNFAGSIILFYFSPLFGFALREHVGHELMNVHFLITGYLFVLALIGIDPVPRRAPYPLRLVMLLATMAFHAFFGVAIMGSTSLMQAGWFGNLGRSWGPSALADQQLGGAIAWGIGEIPTVLVAVGVALMWSKSDARETKRKDRAADRNNEAELGAYNDMFATLAKRDQEIDQRRT